MIQSTGHNLASDFNRRPSAGPDVVLDRFTHRLDLAD
jgi:hypothetical protein